MKPELPTARLKLPIVKLEYPPATHKFPTVKLEPPAAKQQHPTVKLESLTEEPELPAKVPLANGHPPVQAGRHFIPARTGAPLEAQVRPPEREPP